MVANKKPKIWDWNLVPDEALDLLTDAQRKVVDCFRQGMSNQQTAKHLGRAYSNIMQAEKRAQAVMIKHGIDASTGSINFTTPSDQEKEVVTLKMPEQITVTEEHHLKQKLKSKDAELKEVTQKLAEAENVLKLTQATQDKAVKPIKVKRPKGKKNQVAATAFLSDTHFDEVVSSEQSGGVNEYNREIAERRLVGFMEKTIHVSQDLMTGFDIVHLDLPLGGDMVSGNIHEELAASNDAEIMDTVDHWSEKVAEVVVTLSREFPTIFIPCVVGNHGRNTRKPRHKGRVRDNFDWLIYRAVQKNIISSGVRNVQFDISESTDCLWETMGHKYLLTHGDQASGGAGWGGIFSPIMRLYEKKIKAYASRGLSFDYLLMGHWHQFIDAGSVLVNGTTKGYDEFAHNLNFRAEPPQQAFWLTDPRKGKIFSGPLFVDDCKHKAGRAA